MANIDDLREQLEALRTIDKESHKSLLEHIRQRKILDAELKAGKITLEEYNEVVEYGRESLSDNAKEMLKLTEQMHKQTKAVEAAKAAYGLLTSAINTAAKATDGLTGMNTQSLLGITNLATAVGGYARKLQGLGVDLRRSTGFANRHNKSFNILRGSYRQLGLDAESVTVSLTALSTQFSAFDAMTAKNRKSLALTAAEYKTLGVEFEDFAQLNERLRFSFGIMGSSASVAAKEIKRIALETGRPLGTVVKDLNELGPDLARFGSMGLKVFEDLSKRARSLGLGVKEAFDVTELFDTFEGAANIAGRLNAQLGLQLNSVEIMKASSEERLDILRSEFQLQGKNFQSMGRRQKQMIAGILGQSIEATGKLLGDGMDIGAFRAEATTQEQRIKLDEKAISTQEGLIEAIIEMTPKLGGVAGAIKLQTEALNKVANNLPGAADKVTKASAASSAGGMLESALGFGADALLIGSVLRGGFGRRGGPRSTPKGKGGLFSRMGQSIFGKKYKGGQIMKGGGRAMAGGQRSGGLLPKLFKSGGKTLGKMGSKKIPFGLGLAAALGFAGDAYAKGDYMGAGLETASGLAAIVPGAGTAISLGIDGINMTRGNIKTAKGMMSSSGTAPARSAGVPTSSGRSNGQIIVKELVVHSEVSMDKDKFGKATTKVMNVCLDPIKP